METITIPRTEYMQFSLFPRNADEMSESLAHVLALGYRVSDATTIGTLYILLDNPDQGGGCTIHRDAKTVPLPKLAEIFAALDIEYQLPAEATEKLYRFDPEELREVVHHSVDPDAAMTAFLDNKAATK